MEHDDTISAVAIKDSKIAFVLIGRSVNVCDIAGRQLLCFPSHGVFTACVTIGEGCVFYNEDGDIFVRDLTSGEVIIKLINNSAINSIAFSSGYVVNTSDGSLQAWELASGKLLFKLESEASCFAVTPKQIICGFYDGTVLVRDLISGEVQRASEGKHYNAILHIAVSDSYIVTSDDCCEVQIWNITTLNYLASIHFDRMVKDCMGTSLLGHCLRGEDTTLALP